METNIDRNIKTMEDSFEKKMKTMEGSIQSRINNVEQRTNDVQEIMKEGFNKTVSTDTFTDLWRKCSICCH